MTRRLRPFGRLMVALVLLLPVLVKPLPTLAQVQEGATMTVLRGQVAVIHADGSAVQPAPSGTIVNAGDEIRTLSQTGALITFFAGTEIEMGSDTILVVERVTQQGTKVDISLKQVLGMTLNRVQTLSDPTSSYRIDAGGATAVVRGTTFVLIGPVTTSQGNIVALVCLDDCDGRTSFGGCAVSPYTAFGVTVQRGSKTSGCEVAAVERGADYFNAAAESITTFEQAFASGNGESNPGTANLGQERGTRESNERRAEQQQREDTPNQPTSGLLANACEPPGPTIPGPNPGANPMLFAGFGSAPEGDTGTTTLNVPVFLLPPSTQTVSVHYATSGGTATPGVDYTPVSGTLTFAPGQTSQTIAIPVIGDLTIEPDELIGVILSNASGAPISSATGFGHILDDDTPSSIRIFDNRGLEGDAGTSPLSFIVSLNRPAAASITVNYATANGTATAGSDYVATAGTLTFNPGEQFQTVDVQVIGDTVQEPDETFLVNLSNPIGAVLLDNQAVGTIVDDDGPPALSIHDVFAAEGCEGTASFVFDVTLSRPQATPVSVQFATADGTAMAGQDYQATSGTLTFAPGETVKQITVLVIGDAAPEPDEDFFVNLSNPSGASLSVSQGTGVILNDD
ncbi:MAG: FecR domain-containing protein [Chloroflexi bacterium]|nr:FecR domain-containing protein [Chloroflexota bacterium]